MKQIKERRRYFRNHTQLHLHFLQSYENINPHKSSFIDFFSDDIEYTSFCFEEYVKKRKDTFDEDIVSILSDKEEHKQVEQALRTLNQKIKLLEVALSKISKGISPYKDNDFMQQYQEMSLPIRLAIIAGNERTTGIIRNFDDKVLYFLGVVERVVKNSGHAEIYSEEFVRDFNIDDDMIALRRIYGTNRSKLARLFISLYEYLDEIIRVFNDVVNGRIIIEQPDVWALRDVNISAGGIGFTTPYKLFEGMILDLFFQLDNAFDYKGNIKQMHIKAKVVRMQAHPKHYYIGTMFLGVKSKEIDLLNAYVFHNEVNQAKSVLENIASIKANPVALNQTQ